MDTLNYEACHLALVKTKKYFPAKPDVAAQSVGFF